MPVNQVLVMGITAVLIAGLFASTGSFVESQADQAGQHELRVIGSRLAAEIQAADRLAARGGNVSLTVNVPKQVASGSYSVDLLTGPDCDDPTFDADTCLALRTGSEEEALLIPVGNTTAVEVTSVGPGEFVVEADSGGARTAPGGGADEDVGIDVGVGENVSGPVRGGNVSVANEPPVAKFEFDPGAPSSATVINFTATAEDPDGELASYEWDLDGDGSTDVTGEGFNYSYTDPGKYNVTLTVVDDDGDVDSTTRLVVVAGLEYNYDADATDFDDSDVVESGVEFSVLNNHSDEIEITEVSVDPRDDSIDRLADQSNGQGRDKTDLWFDPAPGGGGSWKVEIGADPDDGSLAEEEGPDIPDDGLIIDLDGDAHLDDSGNPTLDDGYDMTVSLNEFREGFGPDPDMDDNPVDVAFHYEVDGEYYASKFTLFGDDSRPPEADFDVVSCDLPANTCTFDSDSTDPDGSIVDYEWQFGDGTTASGSPTETHTFPGNGTYSVTLAVTDDDGITVTKTKAVSTGASFDLRVNFQPPSASVPAGFEPDYGEPYGLRPNGYAYGWNYETDEYRDRGAVAPQQYDTLTHVDGSKYGGADRTWEVSVPDLRYRVYLAAGDPSYGDQVNVFDVEGTTVEDPDGQDYFDEYAATVDVSDGRLTVEPTGGSDNAKVAFVRVESVDTTPFAADNETVVMEAEHYQHLRQGTDDDDGPGDGWDMAGTAWVPREDPDASGEALRAVPGPVDADATKNGPRIDYTVDLGSTGTYYVWVRMRCPDQSSDSVHVGLDGDAVTLDTGGLSTGCAGASGWTWTRRASGNLVSVNVSSPGVHEFTLWLREGGVAIDKIVLSTDPTFDPTDDGPEESDRA
jgi:PKD repeat protein